MSHCPHCDSHHSNYRVVKGTSYEGLSFRKVFYDEQEVILGWSEEPVLIGQEPTVKELAARLIETVSAIEEMLQAIHEPILDEAELEEVAG